MTKSVPEIIRRQWNNLIEGTARRKDADVTKWYGLLQSSYGEEHRTYHNLNHIAALLEDFERLQDQFENPKQVLAAIFFHDIIYQNSLKDRDGNISPLPPAYNEKKSARIARMALSEMGFDRDFCKRVAVMINATADHKLNNPNDRDLALFLDMDMAILGSDQQRYKRYVSEIRQEYNIYDDQLFYKGRLARFVIPTLQSPPIFQTKEFYDTHEIQARRNLLGEQKSIEQWLDQNGHKAALTLKPKSSTQDRF
jgi:predicted metal-dependent HD superfamily phosphohydrolase